MRLNAAGVPLEVALTAGLAHPNLVAARAHTIVRFAPRSRDRTAVLQRDTASLDGRARDATAGPAVGFMAGSVAGSAGPAASAEPAGQPAVVGGAAAVGGRDTGSGVLPAAGGPGLPPLPGHVRGGAEAGPERAASLSAPPTVQRLERSISGSSDLCSERSWAHTSSAGLASSNAGATGGTRTPPRDAREWDSPGAWRSSPAAAYPNPAGEAGGQAGGALLGGLRKQDGVAPAGRRPDVCDSARGERKEPAAVLEEGELWLLLDYCNRGCLGVRPLRPCSTTPPRQHRLLRLPDQLAMSERRCDDVMQLGNATASCRAVNQLLRQ